MEVLDVLRSLSLRLGLASSSEASSNDLFRCQENVLSDAVAYVPKVPDSLSQWVMLESYGFEAL